MLHFIEMRALFIKIIARLFGYSYLEEIDCLFPSSLKENKHFVFRYNEEMKYRLRDTDGDNHVNSKDIEGLSSTAALYYLYCNKIFPIEWQNYEDENECVYTQVSHSESSHKCNDVSHQIEL